MNTDYDFMKEAAAEEASAKQNKEYCYLEVHKAFCKETEGDRVCFYLPPQTIVDIVTPPNGVVDTMDISGGRVYRDAKYAFQSKSNENRLVTRFFKEQKIKVYLKDGNTTVVESNKLVEAVDTANKTYLRRRKEEFKEENIDKHNEKAFETSDVKKDPKKQTEKKKDIEEEL